MIKIVTRKHFTYVLEQALDGTVTLHLGLYNKDFHFSWLHTSPPILPHGQIFYHAFISCHIMSDLEKIVDKMLKGIKWLTTSFLILKNEILRIHFGIHFQILHKYCPYVCTCATHMPHIKL